MHKNTILIGKGLKSGHSFQLKIKLDEEGKEYSTKITEGEHRVLTQIIKRLTT